MSSEKQIDEIAKLICTYPQCTNYNVIGGCKIADCQTVDVAERLYNTGYRKQEWISVSERLPNGDGDFLVWNDFHGVIVGHYFARGKYFISKAVTVTHWMPLPEPPKGE